MISISKPLSAGKTSQYYREEYSAKSSYYSESETLKGDWYGKAAEAFGLAGQQVRAEHFDRLAQGQHPITGEQLIKHRDTIRTREGGEVGHRSAWDLTISAPKSVSIAALVGGDERIVLAHRNAVKAAVTEAENLVQARMGGERPPQTTGKAIVAAFDHDTARPVDGYAAAQLHTHLVLFNMTEDANGQARSVQSHELYVAAPLITSVYQNHLEIELRKLGYEIERGKNHAPEIAGFSKEYLASESRRSQEIEAEVVGKGLVGAASRAIAAHSVRAGKLHQSPEEVRAAHLKNSEKFGNQAQRIVQASEARSRRIRPEQEAGRAKRAVDHAREKLAERESVFDHHQVLTEALRYARGRAGLDAIKRELEIQRAAGLFVPVNHVRPNAPHYRYTTPEAIGDERAIIEAVLKTKDMTPINQISDEVLAARYGHLNEWQRRIVRESLGAERQITGIQGSAGTGKTTSLTVLRELAAESGWKVHGLAPTSGAVKGLREAGITESETMQRFLLRTGEDVGRRLIFMDETSLTAARQMRAVLEKMRPDDRMIIVGDRRQHDSVEAGRIFEELQLAGMQTARINKLVRQSDPGLKEVVKAMAQGRIVDGVDLLGQQGRITSIKQRGKRFDALAKDYAAQPDGTLVVSPDNNSRAEINKAIREELHRQGKIGDDTWRMPILVNKQKVTGADRAVATSYEVGDIVRYRTGSKKLGIDAKSYATVLASDGDSNTVTVKFETGRCVTYDPEKLRGVSLYAPEVRNFAIGDRVQFTAPSRALQTANRDMGQVTHLDDKGNIRIALDSGRTVGFNLKQNQHLEHAYAVTSHSSQGATVDRVLVHIDTGDSRIRKLVNQTLAYVALSRPRHEARIYTDDQTKLGEALIRSQENTTALSREQVEQYRRTA